MNNHEDNFENFNNIDFVNEVTNRVLLKPVKTGLEEIVIEHTDKDKQSENEECLFGEKNEPYREIFTIPIKHIIRGE